MRLDIETACSPADLFTIGALGSEWRKAAKLGAYSKPKIITHLSLQRQWHQKEIVEAVAFNQSQSNAYDLRLK